MKYILIILSIIAFTNCKKAPEAVDMSADEIEVPTSRNTLTVDKAIKTSPFEINQYFETFIAKNETQTEKIEIATPQENAVLMRKADKVKVEIKGFWNTKMGNNKELVLEVFPNHFAQNTGVRPIIEQKLKLNAKDSFLNFSYLKLLKLESGLYYYFLKHNDEVVYVNKFIVK
jgi:hypothetical protein